MKKSILLTVSLPIGMTLGAMPTESFGADSISQINLDEVAVIATRADSQTPIAYTNVTAAEIERLNQGVDIPYILSMTPSIVSTSDAGAGIGYTSMRIRGTDGSRINVTANGIPINDAESHNVYWVNMPDLASSLKDIQIQRGVGTSTNGAGAFGASVNMITANPGRDSYVELDGSYGMYNTHKETVKIGSGLMADHWTAEVRLSNIGTDGYIDRASVELYSYFAQAGYYDGPTSVRLIAFGGKEKTYMAWDYASKDEMAEYGRRYNPCGRYIDSQGNVAFYRDQNDNYAQHHFQLIGRHQFSPQFTLDAALHYTKGDGYYEQYKTGTLVEYGLSPFQKVTIDAEGNQSIETVSKSDLVRLKYMDNGFGGATFGLTYSNGRINGTLGGAINSYNGSHFGQIQWVRNYVGDIDPLQEYYRNRGRKLDGNIYAKANVNIGKGLSGYADMQYRYINYSIKGVSDNYDYTTSSMQILDIVRHYNFFNPKIGINYMAGANRVFVSWSVAHKEPVRDNFIDCAKGHEPVAERMFDYEAGYTFASGNISVGANLYFMNYKNQLVATGQISDTGNAVSTNVPSSYRAGIELQGMWKICSMFDWSLNATFSRNRIKDFVEYIYEDEWTNPITLDHGDSPIAFSPDFTLNNSFNFNFRGFEASLQSHYVSSQYLSNARSKDQMLDAYFVSNLLLGYTFHAFGAGVRVGLTVNNIFNEQYESNGYSGAGYYKDDNGNPVIYRYAGFAAQAPTNVIASVSLKF